MAMIPFEQALSLIQQRVSPGPAIEQIPIHQANGRVLAEAICAKNDLPGFSYSAMDGYAFRMADAAAMEGKLGVVGESRTGRVPEPLAEKAAMRIFTGAQIPPGADTVVMQENVDRVSETQMAITKLPKAGANIRLQGEDMRAGDEAIAAGEVLRPGHLNLIASLDHGQLNVRAKPRVAILCTGDELRPPGSAPIPGHIPESNGISLCAWVNQLGAEARQIPVATDDLQTTCDAFEGALAQHQLLITVGGVSVGDHDLVRPALRKLSFELPFEKVAIKPGKPLTFAHRKGSYVLALPGNPSSAWVTFGLAGVPLIERLSGANPRPLPTLLARLQTPLKQRPGRRQFVRAKLSNTPEGTLVTPATNQASGAPTAMAFADGWIILPEDTSQVAAGDLVQVVDVNRLFFRI